MGDQGISLLQSWTITVITHPLDAGTRRQAATPKTFVEPFGPLSGR
jgi:hypothetical protein